MEFQIFYLMGFVFTFAYVLYVTTVMSKRISAVCLISAILCGIINPIFWTLWTVLTAVMVVYLCTEKE